MNLSRRGILGPTGPVSLLFLFELRWRKFDMVIMECTVDLDMDFVNKMLGTMYIIDREVIGPEDMGFPANRAWTFVVCLFRASPGLSTSG